MAAKQYRTSDGKRVPSVTTICKFVEGDNEGLIRWAHRMGENGVPLEEARQKAASVGSIVHACIEADLRGEVVNLDSVPEEMRAQVDTALGAWAGWKASQEPEMLASELSLVSESYRFGGTLDAVLKVRSARSLFDFKTGNGLYAKDLAQVAGYGLAWDEAHPDEPIEKYDLLRLGKDDGSFHWKSFDAASMQPARSAFICARHAYDHSRDLRSMIR